MNTQTAANRIAPQPGELIDRSRTISFTFNGRSLTAHPGDTIASALLANGVRVIGRSFKYHRPRGLMAYGHDIASMVQIGNEPSVSAWLRPVEQGMSVKSVNVWPSVDRDLMSLTQFGDRFLPVGFYYKTFIRPAFMWPVYEKVLRRAAGLGQIDIEAALPQGYYKQYLHADVVVVGGGPAGLSAAVAAAETGARVALFDNNTTLGGHGQFGIEDLRSTIDDLSARATNFPNLRIFTDATVIGWWQDNWLAAVCGKVLYKIRGKAVVFATGALQQPLIFDNNDLPGIMMGSAVQRLLALYGVTAGQKAVIVTANDDGWQVAAGLHAAGVTVMGVADQRHLAHTPVAAEVMQSGVPAFWQHTIVRAEGSKSVETAVLAPIDSGGHVLAEACKSLACDLIAVSVAWAPDNALLYQAGADIRYDAARCEFLAQALPDGIFAAGRVLGTHDEETEMAEGRIAGLEAAVYAGFGSGATEEEKTAVAQKKQQEPPRTSDLVRVPGSGKQFVDFDEDVTVKDVEMSIAEGYDSIELLKRYSTISMGPSQGKWSSINTIHLTSRLNGWTIDETGTTTSRPPVRPVELAALAGQMMEPVRVTPIHHWHQAHGAKMMVAGLWLRPEHYGDPHAEVQAVRQRVGLIDVSTLGKLKFTGPGVPDFLDKVYVNKWQQLGVGRVRYGVMCNDEGVITDDGVTARVGAQEWYTTTTSSGASAVYEYLQWWLQSGWGDGVHLTNVSEGRAAFNLAGPLSRDVLAQLTDQDVSNEAFPYMHVRQMDVAGVPCRVLRIGFTGELSYEIHCPAAYGLHVWEAIMTAGSAFGIRPFGVEAQRVLRLEKAHIIVGQDTDALTDPIAADMAWIVKADKENFLGNRPLARVADGGPVQKLVGFKMVPGKDGTAVATAVVPEEGLQIVKPNPEMPIGLEIIGWVTSARYSPTLDEVIGLCWLPAALAEQPGATFTIRREKKLVDAHVHHGPFYDPEGARLRM